MPSSEPTRAMPIPGPATRTGGTRSGPIGGAQPSRPRPTPAEECAFAGLRPYSVTSTKSICLEPPRRDEHAAAGSAARRARRRSVGAVESLRRRTAPSTRSGQSCMPSRTSPTARSTVRIRRRRSHRLPQARLLTSMGLRLRRVRGPVPRIPPSGLPSFSGRTWRWSPTISRCSMSGAGGASSWRFSPRRDRGARRGQRPRHDRAMQGSWPVGDAGRCQRSPGKRRGSDSRNGVLRPGDRAPARERSTAPTRRFVAKAQTRRPVHRRDGQSSQYSGAQDVLGRPTHQHPVFPEVALGLCAIAGFCPAYVFAPGHGILSWRNSSRRAMPLSRPRRHRPQRRRRQPEPVSASMPAMRVLTVVLPRTLPQARVLARSLRLHEPEWRLEVAIVGTPKSVAGDDLELVSVAEELEHGARSRFWPGTDRTSSSACWSRACLRGAPAPAQSPCSICRRPSGFSAGSSRS